MIYLTFKQRFLKRLFDIILSLIGISIFFWIVLLAWFLASLDTRSNGFFIQSRVGRDGKLFKVVKVKTMKSSLEIITTVTQLGDPRITKLGAFFRKTKIDELPQLWNVLKGDMSFVGPRPDVPGFADCLQGIDRSILTLRPGITGPATLFFRNEEELLAGQENPEEFNREIIWPEKVRLNLDYIRNWSLSKDINYILQTVLK